MDIAHSPKVGTSDMNILLSEFAMLYKLNNLKKKTRLKDKIHNWNTLSLWLNTIYLKSVFSMVNLTFSSVNCVTFTTGLLA